MADLMRFLLRHSIVGFSAAALFVAGLCLLDLNGFGGLLSRSDLAPAIYLLPVAALGLTFSSAQMGIVLMLGWDTPDDRRPPQRRT
ncbi:MAG: hypothetical protein KAG89_19845 [Fulvimarina manganoxydans]|uniref:hypothetical protein n=1 Tax=Fulvimarina manganoxydans TaxID=937218 RepID=UPI0023532844|nr:hypothetical protein [Fulvimarina manganoxydans]MCK5934412.1 hypothetical protein [Fulvimarina manganoxydans]